jgi:hypothetical protein
MNMMISSRSNRCISPCNRQLCVHAGVIDPLDALYISVQLLAGISVMTVRSTHTHMVFSQRRPYLWCPLSDCEIDGSYKLTAVVRSAPPYIWHYVHTVVAVYSFLVSGSATGVPSVACMAGGGLEIRPMEKPFVGVLLSVPSVAEAARIHARLTENARFVDRKIDDVDFTGPCKVSSQCRQCEKAGAVAFRYARGATTSRSGFLGLVREILDRSTVGLAF